MFTDSWVVVKGLVGLSYLETVRKNLERNNWIDIPKLKKEVKILMSHVNVHQKVISAEEGFIDRKDKMTHSVDSKSLPQAFLFIAHE